MTSIAIDRTDGLSSSTAVKGPVRAATTANISLTGLQTIDGISLATGDRVLVKNQVATTQNGIWVVDTGPWRRAKDFAGNRDVRKGTQIFVTDGTTYASSGFYVSSPDPIVIGVSAILFTQFLMLNGAQLVALEASATAAAAAAVAAAESASNDADAIAELLSGLTGTKDIQNYPVGGATQSQNVGFDNTHIKDVYLDGSLQQTSTYTHVGNVIASVDGSWWYGTLTVIRWISVGIRDLDVWPTKRVGADGEGGAEDLQGLTNLIAEAADLGKALPSWLKGDIDFDSLVPNDTADNMPYLKLLIESGVIPKGARLVLGKRRAPYFPTRPASQPYINFLSDVDLTIVCARELNFSAYAASTSPSFFSATAEYGPELAVTGGDIVKDVTRTITVPEGHGLGREDWAKIYATDELTTLSGAFTLIDLLGTPYNARCVQKQVQSSTSTTVTFFEAFEDNLPASCVPKLKKYVKRPRIRLENPMVLGPGRASGDTSIFDDRFLEIVGGVDVQISGGYISNFGGYAVRLTDVAGGYIEDMDANCSDRTASAGGFLALCQGTQDFEVRNVTVRGGGQVFMTTTGAEVQGVLRRVRFIRNTAINPRDGFSEHNLQEEVSYLFNRVINASANAFDIRSRNAYLYRNFIKNAGSHAVIYRWACNGLVLDKNIVRGAVSGFRQLSGATVADYDPGDITIIRNDLYQIGGSGSQGGISAIYADLRSGTPPVLGKLTIKKNFVEMNVNVTAIRAGGRWADLDADDNTTTGGVAVAVVIDGAGNGVGNGPSNPTFTNHKYGPTQIQPGVSRTDATGKIVDEGHKQIGVSQSLNGKPGGTLAGATTLLPIQSGESYNNTGATAQVVVTLPGAAVGLEYEFVVTDTDGFQLQATSSDTFQIGKGSAGAGNGTATFAVIGTVVKIRGASTTKWIITTNEASDVTVA